MNAAGLDANEFYAQRDKRTRQLGGDTDRLARPVVVRIGASTAASRAGQVALLGLVEQLCRVHRQLDLRIPHATLPDGTQLAATAARIARATDPHINLSLASDDSPSIGIGDDIPLCTWHIGADRWLAHLAVAPQPVKDTVTLFGAMLAACLGAAAMFWHVHDHDLQPLELSTWDLDHGQGPEWTGPLDVGSVAVIGAGAVGAALAYWLRFIRVANTWTFVDKDIVELHNTNRSPGYTAADAGWPGMPQRRKAEVVADLVGAEHYVGWYHEWLSANTIRPDLVLCLANSEGVRHLVGQRSEPVLLHATTSRDYTAELHRHLPGFDQCITCRFPDPGEPLFECSTAPIPAAHDDESTDAALPFLSATAGLLLAATLAQLPAGPLLTTRANHWRLHLAPAARWLQRAHWDCTTGCASVYPPKVRRRLNHGQRWAQLDPATATTDDRD